MTDSKTPLSARDDQPEDSPLDCDSHYEFDSECHAELDLVLETEVMESAWIRDQDIPTEIFIVSGGGKAWHRIAVGGFGSFDQTAVYGETIRSKPGLDATWVGRD